jgi:hypothetical protein
VLLEEFVAVLQLGYLDIEPLSDRADPRIAHQSHNLLLVFPNV